MHAVIHLHLRRSPFPGACQMLSRHGADHKHDLFLHTLIDAGDSALDDSTQQELLFQDNPPTWQPGPWLPEQKAAALYLFQYWEREGFSASHLYGIQQRLRKDGVPSFLLQKWAWLRKAFSAHPHQGPRSRFAQTLRRWRAKKPPQLHGATALYVDGFDLLLEDPPFSSIPLLAALAGPPDPIAVRIVLPDTLSAPSQEVLWNGLLSTLHQHHQFSLEEERFVNEEDLLQEAGTVFYARPRTNVEEADWVASQVQAWIAQGVAPSDIAILAEHPLRQRIILDRLQLRGSPGTHCVSRAQQLWKTTQDSPSSIAKNWPEKDALDPFHLCAVGTLRALVERGAVSHLILCGQIEQESTEYLTPTSFFSDEETQWLGMLSKRRVSPPMLPAGPFYQQLMLRLVHQASSVLMLTPSVGHQGEPALPSPVSQRLLPMAQPWAVIRQAAAQPRLMEHKWQADQARTQFFYGGAPFGPDRLDPTDEATRQVLARYATEQHPLSVSLLEEYTRCPYRFFAKSVLRLQPPRSATPDVDGLVLGQIYHVVLKEFFSWATQTQTWPLVWDDEIQKSLLAFVDAAFATGDLSQVVAAKENSFLIELHRERVAQDIAWLVQQESLHPLFRNAKPTYFEHAFPRIEVSLPGEASVYLSGIADRIDVSRGQLLVLDYKLGGLQSYEQKLRHEQGISSFQLPVYVLALAQDPLLSQHGPARAYYYSVRDGHPSKQFVDASIPIAGPVHHAVQQLRSGTFPITPTSCDRCSYGALCRIPPLLQR